MKKLSLGQANVIFIAIFMYLQKERGTGEGKDKMEVAGFTYSKAMCHWTAVYKHHKYTLGAAKKQLYNNNRLTRLVRRHLTVLEGIETAVGARGGSADSRNFVSKIDALSAV